MQINSLLVTGIQSQNIQCLDSLLSNSLGLDSIKMGRDLKSFKETHLVVGAPTSCPHHKLLVIPMEKERMVLRSSKSFLERGILVVVIGQYILQESK